MTQIKDAGLKFSRARVNLNKVDAIVIHHPVANWSTERVHEYHNSIGWNGIGYNYYHRKNGESFYGRSSKSQEYRGSHAGAHNANTIGVCAEGNFDVETMSDLQYKSFVNLVVFLCEKHGLTHKHVFGHKEMHGASTICPGRNFPMDKFRMDVRLAMMKKTRFSDVPESHWAHQSIEECAKLGIINGFADGSFKPSEPLTRAQIAVIITNLLKVINK